MHINLSTISSYYTAGDTFLTILICAVPISVILKTFRSQFPFSGVDLQKLTKLWCHRPAGTFLGALAQCAIYNENNQNLTYAMVGAGNRNARIFG